MSLQDFFLMRAAQEHQNALNSDTTGIVLGSLAQGVVQGIQQQQADLREQKNIELKNKKAIELYKGIDNGNGTLIPSLKIKEDGSAEFSARTPTPSEQKATYELDVAKRKADAIDKYINGSISDVNLLDNIGSLGISDSEFQVASQARQRIRQLKLEDQINVNSSIKKQMDMQTSGIPDGYRPVYEKDKFGNMSVSKIEPISSSDLKAKQDMEDTNRRIELQNKMVTNQAQDTLDTIAEIKSRADNFGLLGGVPSVPGTDRYIWQSNVDKILSRKIVDLMSEMKNASKTGATGFGQLNQEELKVLKDASTALKKGTPKEKALEYLNAMESSARKVLEGAVPKEKEPLINSYMNKYPDRSRDEIIRALRKRGDL